MAGPAWNRREWSDLSWFWDRVEKTDGCWLWRGPIEVLGYGVAHAANEHRKAHIVAYEAIVGPKPAASQLDHLCRVRHCVNPAHLEPVDHRMNVLRGVGPTAVNAVKDECDKGHPFDEANTYLRPGTDGNRDCRTCRRERSLAWYYRKKARAAA